MFILYVWHGENFTFRESVDITRAGFFWGSNWLVPHLLFFITPLLDSVLLASSAIESCCPFFNFNFRIGPTMGTSTLFVIVSMLVPVSSSTLIGTWFFTGDWLLFFSWESLLPCMLLAELLRDLELDLDLLFNTHTQKKITEKYVIQIDFK